MPTDYRTKLQSLLRELFQFDSADLDFGIYRIMNQKRAEVDAFIQHDLLDAVSGAFEEFAQGVSQNAQAELQALEKKVRDAFGDTAFDDVGNIVAQYQQLPLTLQYSAKRDEAKIVAVSAEQEAQVFNDLYTFFARYYSEGDFITLRRYGRDKYAIPYNGEEVMLHWANRDQYYVKTAETFRDYVFKVQPGGYTVYFKLTAAEIEQNNVKGENRYFIPRAKAPVSVDAAAKTCTLFFEYRPLIAAEKETYGTRKVQDAINEAVAPQLLSVIGDKTLRGLLAKMDDDGQTALYHHLSKYTRRNTSDYFIHKDLRGFLQRELDFYIKNEIFRLDDLGGDLDPAEEPPRRLLARAKVVRHLGRQMIDFLAQIEDFQKRLFEKKKFVTQTEWCLTLDHIAEDFYPEIIANKAQWAEWENLFKIKRPKGNGKAAAQFLKDHPSLVLDTQFFDADFKDRLLASIENLDEQTDGVLIHSENFQALSLLQERYRESVKCIYIDPPYNTGNDGFIYKDKYQHSTWLTMMDDRLRSAKAMLFDDGAAFVSIGDNEQENLKAMLADVFGNENWLATIVWKRTVSQPVSARAFATDHEYVLAFGESASLTLNRLQPSDTSSYKNPDNDPRGPYKAQKFERTLSGARPTMTYAIETPTGAITRTWSGPPSTYRRLLEEKRIVFSKSGLPYYKQFLSEITGITPSTIWQIEGGYNQHAAKELIDLFGDKPFDTVKPVKLITRILELSSISDSWVLDFFAGSGTTAHAVISLNREDDGSRKYILVEMGDYFDTVLKPRVQKVIYATEWENGKPLEGAAGVSHIFKYQRLESYEDTLNNLVFDPALKPQQELLPAFNDYMLRYMLDHETRTSGSRLNVDNLAHPFDYTLNLARNGENIEAAVDLIETFNYLLGLTVTRRLAFKNQDRTYRVVFGTLNHDSIAIIWRDLDGLDLEQDQDFITSEILKDTAPDRIFINGDSYVTDAESLDPIFKQRMAG